jgi:CelD/BcsL family acetyltransferase involved in cellulose biosynthesis
VKVKINITPEVFDTLAGEWNSLLQRSVTNTLFLTLEWQKAWWSGLGDGDLRVLEIRDDDSVLQGIAPLYFVSSDIGGAHAAFVGCKEVSDYLDFIFAREHEDECYQALIDYLASGDCPAWDSIVFCNIPEPSPTLTIFAEMARKHGWRAEVEFEDVSPIIQLPADFDTYLASLDGKDRRELQRKLRRAGNEVTISVVNDATTLDKDMDDFLRLMVASMPSKASFMTPRMASFFHIAARAMQNAGTLQLAFLEVEGVRAATYMNFIYDNAVLVYNSGLDPMKFAYLSPGQVLIGRLIEMAIKDRRRIFDFLQGNESYKYKLGGKDLRLHTLTIAKN